MPFTRPHLALLHQITSAQVLLVRLVAVGQNVQLFIVIANPAVIFRFVDVFFFIILKRLN